MNDTGDSTASQLFALKVNTTGTAFPAAAAGGMLEFHRGFKFLGFTHFFPIPENLCCGKLFFGVAAKSCN